tara:strand:+ start:238 stop:570 length:333 start_codon:yes stop_codon:yes gene_type:complete
MANAYKVLAQSAPAITTATDVYTVPAATEAVISTLIIANRAAAPGTYRISVRPNGAAQSDLHYIAYDIVIAANDSTTLTLGMTLDAADVVTVYCSSADMSVNIFGTEITA